MLRFLLLSSLLWITFCLCAQDKYEQADIYLKQTNEKIIIDGILDEAAWYSGEPAQNFWSNFPTDSVLSPVRTEIYMTYDDNNLYVAAKCYSIGQNYIVPLIKKRFQGRRK